MILMVKCLRCGHKLVLNVGEGGLEAANCSICGAPGVDLELIGDVNEMMPDSELIAGVFGRVA